MGYYLFAPKYYTNHRSLPLRTSAGIRRTNGSLWTITAVTAATDTRKIATNTLLFAIFGNSIFDKLEEYFYCNQIMGVKSIGNSIDKMQLHR